MKSFSPATIIRATLILAATWLAAGCAPAPSYKPNLDALVDHYGLDDAQRESARQAYADWSRENKDLQASVSAGHEAPPDFLLRQALLAQRLDGELRRVLNEEQYQEFRRSPRAADPSGFIPLLAQTGDPWAAVQALGGIRLSESLVWQGNFQTRQSGQILFSSWNGERSRALGNLKQVVSEESISMNCLPPSNDHERSNEIYSITVYR